MSNQSGWGVSDEIDTGNVLPGHRHPTHIHYIQGFAQIPSGFEQVETIAFAPGQITLKSPTGQSVTVPVQHEFQMTGSLRKTSR